jgi:hypothetical protein
MSNDRCHIERGVFLRGGTHPARIAHTPARQHPSFLDDPTSLKEMKSRLQHLREALDYIRSEKPPAVETQE